MAYHDHGTGPIFYRDEGEGEPLLLLHPGGTDGRAYEPLLPLLGGRFRTLIPDRPGHGRTPDAPGPFSFGEWGRQTAAFLDEVVGGPASVVGYSAGAILALTLALERPDLVRRLVVVAGVFDLGGWEAGVLDEVDAPMAAMEDAYAEVSPDGREHWAVVVAKAAAMHRSEPRLTEDDLARVRARTLVVVGDDDEVRLEHAVAMYRAIPDSELAVVPGTSHALLFEKRELCMGLMVEHLLGDPVATLAPRRRA